MAVMLCQDCHGLLEYLNHPELNEDCWGSNEFVVAITWIDYPVGHHRDVGRILVLSKVVESFPHNHFEQTRLDEVAVALAAHSVHRDTLDVTEWHGNLGNYIKGADA
jgi:hypothetical protein